jgi:class 3 adenylate cyclase/tetratricopeptide (TPR) repeat protein
VRVCPSCGRENADDARFCSGCGRALEAEGTEREERKVVTCLFCDLVGFTARAEQMDPEDVRQVLQPYHARVREELMRFGGTVEKFIGDAVMAVFGAPVAHEDDPERAVRAALAIRETFEEDGRLDVRVGITTGEALIALGARPEEGEGMASGDVVNTAARLQSAAPVNGILVDETTFRATERTIRYDEASPVDAKGKSERVPVWEAREAKSRFGVDVRQLGSTPLVGREDELQALLGALNRARRAREPQLVTLVGVPGIGKSRLVWELFQQVDSEHELTWWRQGRSLPYGEGVSFWALGEMVKAQAGVLESDSLEQAAAKLRESVATLVSDDADVEWLIGHLRPLVGLEADGDSVGRRDEAFAAWRRFLEALAEERPLVLVFEDLHWADDSLLDFVDYLVDWASGVPLLVVGTARPELLSRRPGWGGGKPNASTLSLSALSNDETARLVHALLDRPVLDAEVQRNLLERAGGNPLYAEEFVRMLEERADGDLPLPETVQGLIAARLDGLTNEEKSLLQAGSVLGKVFWLGAAVELAGVERHSAEEWLHALERKEFLRRERRSSVAGDIEYAFRHLLVRDVAYGQIPRGVRAERHRSAARWIESLGRPEDHAEMLAHHYLRALELARATGDSIDDIAHVAAPVVEDAGDRAFSLNSHQVAIRFYEEALGLGVADEAGRAALLFKRARALFLAGDDRRERALEEARLAEVGAGDPEHAAEADALLAELWWHRGDRDRSRENLERAAQSIAALAQSPAKARVLSQIARYKALAEENEEAITAGRAALAMAESFSLDDVRAHALNNIGLAKIQQGDMTGLDDLERSIEIAVAARSPDAARSSHNLGIVVWTQGDFRRSCKLVDEAVALGERFGNAAIAEYSRHVQTQQLFVRGEWSAAGPRADELLAACDAGESHYMESGIRDLRARLRLARDDVTGATEDLERSLPAARKAGDPQAVYPTLATAARLYLELGRRDEAVGAAREAIDTFTPTYAPIDLAWVAEELELSEEVKGLLAHVPVQTPWHDVVRAYLASDYVAGADVLHEIGDAFEEAAARLRAAEELVAAGRAEADEQLQRSLAFWRSVGATRYVRQGEALLAAAS